MTEAHILFVYGTLKKGGKWHHLMANSKLLEDNDFIYGDMYLFQELYPVLFVGEKVIRGETYSVPDDDYQKVVSLEAGALYEIRVVKTRKGYKSEVFFYTDHSVRNPELRIQDFNAVYYFREWLKVTPRGSESFQFFIDWGGQIHHPNK